jgi:hypothetical protein
MGMDSVKQGGGDDDDVTPPDSGVSTPELGGAARFWSIQETRLALLDLDKHDESNRVIAVT